MVDGTMGVGGTEHPPLKQPTHDVTENPATALSAPPPMSAPVRARVNVNVNVNVNVKGDGA
ncbi:MULTISPECIES: hypothetical protein [unclassified Streptomyces]|uniref:hypothetical protein n=1 Tax=unclassified Streptomyces TaxID=2593676 RepID=UPI00382A2F83